MMDISHCKRLEKLLESYIKSQLVLDMLKQVHFCRIARTLDIVRNTFTFVFASIYLYASEV